MASGKRLVVLSCSATKRDDTGLLPALERYNGPMYQVLRTFLREKIRESLNEFDGVVAQIEESVAEESAGERLPEVWDANPREETCTVCDFKTFCPESRYRGAPTAP